MTLKITMILELNWTAFYGTKESVETHFPFLYKIRFAKL